MQEEESEQEEQSEQEGEKSEQIRGFMVQVWPVHLGRAESSRRLEGEREHSAGREPSRRRGGRGLD